MFFKDVEYLESFISNGNRVFDIPFDSTRKMMSVISERRWKETCYVKGAPERVIEKCALYFRK